MPETNMKPYFNNLNNRNLHKSLLECVYISKFILKDGNFAILQDFYLFYNLL